MWAQEVLKNLADVERDGSFAIKLRQKRNAFFKELMASIPKPIRILDVGGTETFWKRFGFFGNKKYKITILNLKQIRTHYSNFIGVIGDARNMHEFSDKEFDIVFSNSVIEHLGTHTDQKRMAEEILRVGKRYLLQTPNFYFPFEPHFLFPFFQFCSMRLKMILLRHFNLGGYGKIPDKEKARVINSIRLLKKQELRKLLPEAVIHEEKICGLTFSFVAYYGW